MKNIFTRNKGKIIFSILFLLLFLAIFLLYFFFFTDRLTLLYDGEWSEFWNQVSNFEKGTIISILIAIIFGYFFFFLSKLDQGDKTISIDDPKSLGDINKYLEENKIDPRDIEKYIKDLPFENKEKTEEIIEKWYRGKKISSKEKEHLLVINRAIFKEKKNLEEIIVRLRSEGKDEIANFYQNIQSYLKEKKAKEDSGSIFC